MNPSTAAVWLACLGLLTACSGDDFEGNKGGTAGAAGEDAGSGGSGGSAGSSGVSGTAGSGGDSGSSGKGGAAGSGGSAGAPPCEDGQCAHDEYCNSKGVCTKCQDLSEVAFSEPEALEKVNVSTTLDVRSPRPVDDKNVLLYTIGNLFTATKIWLTLDFTANSGFALPAPVNGGNFHERDALVTLPDSDGPLAGMSLFFDRTVDGNALSARQLFGAKYDDANDVFLTPVLLPEPFNNPTNGTWSIAVAPLAERAWFVSNREGTYNPKLYTASFGANPSAVATSVSLVTAPYSCPVKAFELAPWVTADGSVLFFQAPETAANCVEGQKHDIYWTLLNSDGQPAGIIAQPLAVNLQNTHEFSPAFSPDGCWLFFSSDRNLSSRLQAYRARRI